MIKKILYGVLVFVVCVLAFAVKTYFYAGEYKTITSRYDGTCRAVTGISGAEDITIHPGSGLAFISSYNRFSYKAGEPTPGAIFTLDFRDPKAVPEDIALPPKLEFHPHGISLYEGENGETYLFAINHNERGNFVEIYQYVDGQLEHQETVTHELMHEPNDLIAVGPREFYLSNHMGSTSSLGQKLERFIPLSRSYVLYYDGNTMRKAAEDIGAANGMAVSPDGTKLYVAATQGKHVLVYDRDPQTAELALRDTIALDGFPDNIEMDRDGNLLVAVLPKALTYLAHRKDPDVMAPTMVVKITFGEGGDYEVSNIYTDDGSNIKAATVAAPFPGGFLLGPSRDDRNHILVCRNE